MVVLPGAVRFRVERCAASQLSLELFALGFCYPSFLPSSSSHPSKSAARSCIMDASPSTRQRLNAAADEISSSAKTATPSELENGTSSNNKPNGDNAVNQKDSTSKPPAVRKKSRRFKEFKDRLQGKHLERTPTIKESLIATVQASCKLFSLSPTSPAMGPHTPGGTQHRHGPAMCHHNSYKNAHVVST